MRYLKAHGIEALRKAQTGQADSGDIACPNLPLIIQAKNHKRLELAGWCDAARAQADAAGVAVGAVVAKRRRGPGSSGSVGSAYVIMALDDFIKLLENLGALEN